MPSPPSSHILLLRFAAGARARPAAGGGAGWAARGASRRLRALPPPRTRDPAGPPLPSPPPRPPVLRPGFPACVHVLSRLGSPGFVQPLRPSSVQGCGRSSGGNGCAAAGEGIFPGPSSSVSILIVWLFWGCGVIWGVRRGAFWTRWEGVEDVVSRTPPGDCTRAGCSLVVNRGRRKWLPVDFIVLRFKCGLWYVSLHFMQGKEKLAAA